jgi:hypothetical protein
VKLGGGGSKGEEPKMNEDVSPPRPPNPGVWKWEVGKGGGTGSSGCVYEPRCSLCFASVGCCPRQDNDSKDAAVSPGKAVRVGWNKGCGPLGDGRAGTLQGA